MESPGNVITGESWHDYFARLRREGVIGATDAEREDDDDPRVIIAEAHFTETAPTPIKRAITLARRNEWDVVGPCVAESIVPGDVYKSGAREGQRRPDRHIDQYWVDLISPEQRTVIRVSCEVVNGTARPAVRRLWGRAGAGNVPLSDATMRSIINGE